MRMSIMDIVNGKKTIVLGDLNVVLFFVDR